MTAKLIIGCGYLGERVARAWVASGAEVAVLTRSQEHAAGFRKFGLSPVIGDILEPASLAGLPPADTVLYAVGFDRSASHTRREVYVDGLRNVLEALAGRVDRFIYISSTSVYGQNGGETIDEESECRPTRENGQICLEAERTLKELLPSANILRLAGIYGPGRLLRREAELKSATPISGNPEAFLNLIHVEDAKAAVLACEAKAKPGATYLVADDRPVRRREYYTRLAELFGAPPPTFAEAADPTANLNKRCNNRKLGEELGLRLQYTTVEEGLPSVK